MNPAARRILITGIVILAAAGVAAVVIFGPGRSQRDAEVTPANQNDPAGSPPQSPEGGSDDLQGSGAPDSGQSGDQQDDGVGTDDEGADALDADQSDQRDTEQDADEGDADGSASDFSGLRAVAPGGGFGDAGRPTPIGSLDWRAAPFLVEFSTFAAGIDRITFSDIWRSAEAKREADRVKSRIESGEASLADMPDDQRYVIQQTRTMVVGGTPYQFPAFSARQIEVVPASGGDPVAVDLFGDVWSQSPDNPGDFTTEIRNGADVPILRITRRFALAGENFDLALTQTIENLSGSRVRVTLLIYGPADLPPEFGLVMENRRYRAGHLADVERFPARTIVLSDGDFLLSRDEVRDLGISNQSRLRPPDAPYVPLWPNADSAERHFELSWYAVESRYFAVAIHPLYAGDGEAAPRDRSLADEIASIYPFHDGSSPSVSPDLDRIMLELRGAPRDIPAGESASISLGIYAGPLDRHVLGDHEPFSTLRMDHLIHYQMSAMCAWCTFQWLAHLLIWFLSIAHAIFFDWGVAIILLVVVVRLLLHPITKRSQISMQRFAKVMQKIKPEMEKLQAKHRDDPKRYQQEQLRLWREHGVSPFSMLGCLPLILQMPIWIALYAMLYFAFDLRHEPAFWGVFQLFGDWTFLGDLSAPDRFIPLPFTTTFWMFDLSSFNILPLLMGGVFFVQQKYLTPPPTGTMTPEQQMQQRILRFMMVVMMPVFMYSVPSGLTLYILTSSVWGIIESRHIRRHVDAMDLAAPAKRDDKKKKPKDALSRRYFDAIERAKAKRQPPPKKFKERG